MRIQFHFKLNDNNSRAMLITRALSQLVCALIGGKAHQTLCCMAWDLVGIYECSGSTLCLKGIKGSFLKAVLVVMDTLEPSHCKASYMSYRDLTQGPGFYPGQVIPRDGVY